MNSLKVEIMNILYTTLNGVYCDSCRFSELEQEESERIFGYYGCEGCIRKSMNWEISEECCVGLTNKILKVIEENNNGI